MATDAMPDKSSSNLWRYIVLTQCKACITIMLAILLMACSETVTETPEQLVQVYAQAMAEYDDSKGAALFYVSDDEMPKEVLSLIRQGVQARFAVQRIQHGKLKSLELGNIIYSSDNQRAMAEILFIYPDNKIEKEQWALIKIHNNWKIEMQ